MQLVSQSNGVKVRLTSLHRLSNSLTNNYLNSIDHLFRLLFFNILHDTEISLSKRSLILLLLLEIEETMERVHRPSIYAHYVPYIGNSLLANDTKTVGMWRWLCRQEKPTNCGTKLADVPDKFSSRKL